MPETKAKFRRIFLAKQYCFIESKKTVLLKLSEASRERGNWT